VRIYFDHNATTPLHPAVIAAMAEAAGRCFGNPSSLHEEGRASRQAVERARAEVAALLGADPQEIVFTSGGTESNNTAIAGAARALFRSRGRRGQLLSSPIEHPSVAAALDELSAEGWKVTRLPVDRLGRIDPADLERALKQEETALVSLSLCNHELGNLYPIAELCEASHRHGALFHCDAVQAAGRIPVDAAALGADLISVSAHKLYGPKGMGALVVRSRGGGAGSLDLAALPPLLRGGSQEKGRRAGTENLLGIVGLGAAASLCRRKLVSAQDRVAALRDALEERLLRIPGARRHGDGTPAGRGPSTTNLAFDGVEGELLFMSLDLRGIAVSTGAACSSGSPEPSAVLLALGLDRPKALEAVRFSLGPENTGDEVERVAEAVRQSVALIRSEARPGAKN